MRRIVVICLLAVCPIVPLENALATLPEIPRQEQSDATRTNNHNHHDQRHVSGSNHEIMESADDDMPQEQFCMDMKNMRMVMFTKGFRRSLSSSKDSMLPCLSYYVRSWVLDDRGKFHGAMIYSFLLGLVTQGVAVTRVVVSTHVRKGSLRKYLMVAIYVLQVFFGYMIMLVAMTYSTELLLSAVAGLSFGYFLFHKREQQPLGRNELAAARSDSMREPLLAAENRIETATSAGA